MHQGRMVFSQVVDYFPVRAFQSIVERYQGDRWVQQFTCRHHFNVMAFAQLTGRESLRDIETCLNANRRHLHHMGIQSGISRNNLAHANEVLGAYTVILQCFLLAGLANYIPGEG